MGQVERNRENQRDNKRERAKAGRSRRREAAGAIDITQTDWAPLVALVEALAAEGGALRIGLTRDGGAYALGVYLGDDYATEYVRPNEDFDAAIIEIADAWLGGTVSTHVWNRVLAIRGTQGR